MLLGTMLAMAMTPDQFDDRVQSMDDLQLEPKLFRLVDEPLHFEDGPVRLTITKGVVVPVFSGRFAGDWERNADRWLRKQRQQDPDARLPDAEERGTRELVGFVLTDGEGTLTVDMPHRADALSFANHQVLHNGASVERMAPIAHGERAFETTLDRGLFLSASPVVDELFLGDAEADPFEVVVYEGGADPARAALLLQRRLDLWDGLGVDWAQRVAEDRVLPGADRLFFEVRTADRYRRVSDLGKGQDRWLAWASDPRGVDDAYWRARLVTAGVTPEGVPFMARLSGEPHPRREPDDPWSSPEPRGGVRAVEGRVRVLADWSDDHLAMEVRHEAVVKIEARGPSQVVTLRLPREEAVPRSFRVVGVKVDGTSVATPRQLARSDAEARRRRREETEESPRGMDEVNRSKVVAVLPEVLDAGDTATLELTWTDTWRVGSPPGCGLGSGGLSSGVHPLFPSIDGATSGGPWTYRATVGVPEGSGLTPVVSGVTASRSVQQGWRLVDTERTENARWPEVSIGRFTSRREEGGEGYPAVSAHLLKPFPGQLEQFPVHVRQIAKWMEGYLPSFPVEELDIVQAPDSCFGFVWKAPHGMAEVQRAQMDDTLGFAEQVRVENGALATLAHEVAHQYWGQLAQPAGLDDRWLVESLAELYACMYVAAAAGDPKPCARRLDQKRRRWDRRRNTDIRFTASLSEAFRGTPQKNAIVYDYGPYILLNVLRPQIGTEKMFLALDVMLREHPYEEITTERVQHYLEAASGEDLEAFFDFWIHQGILPKVVLRWSVVDGAVVLAVTSDVPFGSFEVPVRVTEGEREVVQRVVVRDGEGYLTVPGGPWREPSIELDPYHAVLARAEVVHRDRGAPTAQEEGGPTIP